MILNLEAAFLFGFKSLCTELSSLNCRMSTKLCGTFEIEAKLLLRAKFQAGVLGREFIKPAIVQCGYTQSHVSMTYSEDPITKLRLF